jgi:Family of unknown function (DUF5683)
VKKNIFLFLSILGISFISTNSHAQKIILDSTGTGSIKIDTSKKKKKPFKFTDLKPKTEAGKRFMQSMLVPGLGQIKNKQYGYLPIIYGGVAAAGYFMYDFSTKYNYYLEKRTTAYKGKKEVTIENYPNRTFTAEQLKPVTDAYRRYKEVTVLSIVLGWTLQAVQANVGYHLKTFDTKDDISFKIEPKISNFGNQNGLGLSATYTFSSKITK